MIPQIDLKDYIKTPEGIEDVNTQIRFCLGGSVWSSLKGNVYKCPEKVMTDEELKGVKDVDGTMTRVWLERKQRLEGRYQRKMDEYDDRRAKCRAERTGIRQAVKEDKELGLPPSSDDLAQLERIDKRQKRLVGLKQEQELALATVMSQIEGHQAVDPIENVELKEVLKDSDSVRPTCEECGKEVPPGKNPTKWMRAHMMGAHIGPARRRELKQEKAQAAAAGG
jgi:hypothetical protein